MRRTSSGSARVSYPRFSPRELLERLRSRVPALEERLPLRRLTLFGSYARGRATASSDIDLLVVYRGSPREDAYAVVRRVMALRGLEPHVYAEQEYEAGADRIERMVRGGIEILT